MPTCLTASQLIVSSQASDWDKLRVDQLLAVRKHFLLLPIIITMAVELQTGWLVSDGMAPAWLKRWPCYHRGVDATVRKTISTMHGDMQVYTELIWGKTPDKILITKTLNDFLPAVRAPIVYVVVVNNDIE